jgi:hypothetical protein
MEKQAVAPKKGINVMVAVPCMSEVSAFFAYDLAQLMAFTNRHFVKEGVIDWLGMGMVQATYVHSARQELCSQMLSNDCDYILFLDSDMRFPQDALVKLLQHQEPIVGVNYVKRNWPPKYVAIKTLGDIATGGKGQLLGTRKDDTGLEECEAIGFGVALIRRDVLLSLPDPRENGPWFWYEWQKDAVSQIGEDVYFCNLARKAGWKVLVDHDLSKVVKHIGHEQFGLEHAWAVEKQQAEETDGDSDQLLDAGDGDSPDPESDGSVDGHPELHSEGGEVPAAGLQSGGPGGPDASGGDLGGDGSPS